MGINNGSDAALTSPGLAEIAQALVKVQSSLLPVARTSRNPFFNSTYADLAAIWEAIRSPLAANGLAVVQTLDAVDEKGVIALSTLLLHTSGEWIRSTLTMPLQKTDPQAIGSAITYARRYALMAMVGVASADEDDDAEGATTRETTTTRNRPRKAEPVARPVGRAKGEPPKPSGPATAASVVTTIEEANQNTIPTAFLALLDDHEIEVTLEPGGVYVANIPKPIVLQSGIMPVAEAGMYDGMVSLNLFTLDNSARDRLTAFLKQEGVSALQGQIARLATLLYGMEDLHREVTFPKQVYEALKVAPRPIEIAKLDEQRSRKLLHVLRDFEKREMAKAVAVK